MSRRSSKVPKGRLTRLTQLGRAAGKIAASGVKEGARRILGGEARSLPEALLNVENATALAERLSRLRGAAMKLGQMLSLEGDNFLPKEVGEALAVLRASADVMPTEQVHEVLAEAYGDGFRDHFSVLHDEPIASASIGQVHYAESVDGRKLALKLQYPGVAESIDSDVDNLASLLSLSRVIPGNFDFSDIVDELKRQLHEEADYLRELKQGQAYGEVVAGFEGVRVPKVYADLTRRTVLAMEYVDCPPLVEWAHGKPQEERNRVATVLLRLMCHELLGFGLMQTDPNFANYLYDEDAGSVVLLDFGATRTVPGSYQRGYRALIKAALGDSRPGVRQALKDMNMLSGSSAPEAESALLDLIMIATEPLRHQGEYDFARTGLKERVREPMARFAKHKLKLAPPPPETLFFQRKLGGMFLLCRRLGARVDVPEVVRGVLAEAEG